MTWILISLTALALLLAATVIVGLLLPENYDATVRLRLDRTPDQVWAAICDARANPVSAAMARSVTPLPDEDGKPVWCEDMGSTKLTVRTVEAAQSTKLVRRIADSVVPMTADIDIRIEPDGAGCRITATNHTVIRRGTWHVPIFRLILKLTNGVNRSQREYWNRLARNLGTTARYE